MHVVIRELTRLAKEIGADAFVLCAVMVVAWTTTDADGPYGIASGLIILALYISYCLRQRSVQRHELELRRLAMEERLQELRDTRRAARAKLGPKQPRLPLESESKKGG